jgi:beta-glucosidase/6-phospho-beta-glucosidase/beta-galactosidase
MNKRGEKQVMRTLKVITENASINQQAVEDYENLFQHPLTQSHVEALAALFGWETPGNLFP